MNELSDRELLRDYAERHSEPAFTELVRRHVDFVYSAALRMVSDPHTAEDVAQNTFIALAKNAAQLRDRSVLSSWLHSTARNLAANNIRMEVRRRSREQEAAVMNELLANEPQAVWKNIAPHLDDAIAELGDSYRDALLLRYFERKSAREIGQIFGTSEEAAQKRVSRAVGRLREFFSKRGITIGAGGLIVLVSANAVQSAPMALATTISAAVLAGTAIPASTAIAATKTIAMTAIQKTIIGASLSAAIIGGIYEHHQATLLKDQDQMLRKQQVPMAAEAQRLQQRNSMLSERLDALMDENKELKKNSDELLKLRGEVAQLTADSQGPGKLKAASESTSTEAVANSWAAKIQLLKNYLRQNPPEAIPEIRFMTDRDWLASVDPSASYWELSTDNDYDKAMNTLRDEAQMEFYGLVNDALIKFYHATSQNFPVNFAQLQPYLAPELADTLAQEYEMTPATNVPMDAIPAGAQLAAETVIRRKTPVNKNGPRLSILPLKRNEYTFYAPGYY